MPEAVKPLERRLKKRNLPALHRSAAAVGLGQLRDARAVPELIAILGDAERDVAAARSAGCRPALVRSGKPLPDGRDAEVPVFDDLAHFAHALLGEARVVPDPEEKGS